MKKQKFQYLLKVAILVSVAQIATQARAQIPDALPLPTGQFITPTAARGSVFQALKPHVASSPNYTVGQAMSTAVSPDGKTLLVLTSGFNLNANAAGTATTT